MFDFIKQVQQLKQVQEALKNEKYDLEKDGVRLSMSGQLKIEELKLNANLPIARQQEIVKDLVNEAVDKIQSSLAEKLHSKQ